MKNCIMYKILAVASVASAFFVSVNSYGQEKKQSVREYLEQTCTLSGYAQAGASYESVSRSTGEMTNSMTVNRAIVIAGFNPVESLNVGFMADFINFKLHEYFVEYKPFRQFALKFGQFKNSYTIENNMSPAVVEVIRGAQSVQYLAGMDGSDVCFSAGAGRDIGLEANGHLIPLSDDGHNLIFYRIGVFNGEPYNHKETNVYKDLSAMLTISPMKCLKLTGSLYLGHATAYADNIYGAFAQGDVYKRDRWSAGLEFGKGWFYLRSEYLQGMDADIASRGAYATVRAGLTKSFDLILSADYFDRNLAMGDWQCNYLAGLQWKFFKKCRLQLQYAYEQRNLTKSSHFVITQLQVGF